MDNTPSRCDISSVAHQTRLLFYSHGISSIKDISRQINKNLCLPSFSSYLSVSNRVYDENNSFCYQLCYKNSVIEKERIYPLIIEINPIAEKTRFIINCKDRINTYSLLMLTIYKSFIQRKVITNARISSILEELQSLTNLPCCVVSQTEN